MSSDCRYPEACPILTEKGCVTNKLPHAKESLEIALKILHTA